VRRSSAACFSSGRYLRSYKQQYRSKEYGYLPSLKLGGPNRNSRKGIGCLCSCSNRRAALIRDCSTDDDLECCRGFATHASTGFGSPAGRLDHQSQRFRRRRWGSISRTRDHALAFHGLVVHSERRPNAPNFFPPRIVCCAPVTTIQAATMGFNLADATRLGNGELCARGFGKSWISLSMHVLQSLGSIPLLRSHARLPRT
jgi:hypothetical protein